VHQNYLRELVLFRLDPRHRALRFLPALQPVAHPV
jgi:hypothetical protein